MDQRKHSTIRFPGKPNLGQSQGASTSNEVRGTPSSGHVRGTPSSGNVRGTPSAGHIRGTRTSVYIRGTPSLAYVRGQGVSGYIRGTPSSGHIRGTPSMAFLRGTPSSAFVRGAPSSGHVRGTPSSAYIRGTPSSGHVRGTPSSAYVRGTPSSAFIRGTPSAGHVLGTPSTAHFHVRPSLAHLQRRRSSDNLYGRESSTELYQKPTAGRIRGRQSYSYLKARPSFGYLTQKGSGHTHSRGGYSLGRLQSVASFSHIRGCPSCEAMQRELLPPCPVACMSEKCKAVKVPVINIHHKPVVWVMGGPGCGKGTQCDLIKQKYGFTHISSGELLRNEVNRGGEQARKLHDIMARGGLVPNEVVLTLVREEMRRLEPTSKGFLIDGYPREEHQGPAFEKAVAPVSVIIYFRLSPETLLQRLKHRAAVAEVRRLDDTESIFRLRIDTFLHHNQKILNQYTHKLYTINAERPVAEIFDEVQKHLGPILEKADVAFKAHIAAISAAAAAKSADAETKAQYARLGPKRAKDARSANTGASSIPMRKDKKVD